MLTPRRCDFDSTGNSKQQTLLTNQRGLIDEMLYSAFSRRMLTEQEGVGVYKIKSQSD